MLTWSRDPKAPYFLGSVSFMESSFFPIPPDVMLISMGMVKPKSVWQYAFITTVFSVLGGILGYVIGAYAITWILPMLKSVGYYDNYLNVQAYFRDYGIGFVIVAGFTPIPYKLFTIAAGTMNMALLPFIMASIIGRGMRFFLVATLMYYQGEKIEKKLTQHIEKLSWLIVSLFLLGYMVIKLWH